MVFIRGALRPLYVFFLQQTISGSAESVMKKYTAAAAAARAGRNNGRYFY